MFLFVDLPCLFSYGLLFLELYSLTEQRILLANEPFQGFSCVRSIGMSQMPWSAFFHFLTTNPPQVCSIVPAHQFLVLWNCPLSYGIAFQCCGRCLECWWHALSKDWTASDFSWGEHAKATVWGLLVFTLSRFLEKLSGFLVISRGGWVIIGWCYNKLPSSRKSQRLSLLTWLSPLSFCSRCVVKRPNKPFNCVRWFLWGRVTLLKQAKDKLAVGNEI